MLIIAALKLGGGSGHNRISDKNLQNHIETGEIGWTCGAVWCGGSSLTAAPDATGVGGGGMAVGTPPAAVNLEDAVVGGSISVAVGGFSVVVRLPLG